MSKKIFEIARGLLLALQVQTTFGHNGADPISNLFGPSTDKSDAAIISPNSPINSNQGKPISFEAIVRAAKSHYFTKLGYILSSYKQRYKKEQSGEVFQVLQMRFELYSTLQYFCQKKDGVSSFLKTELSEQLFAFLNHVS